MKHPMFFLPVTTRKTVGNRRKIWLPLLLVANMLNLPFELGAQSFVMGNQPLITSPGTSQYYPDYIITLDVNHDGKLDLITANTGTSANLSVLTNNGAGNFQLSRRISTDSGLTYFIATADVNGDGNLDLITADYASLGAGSFTVLTNNGADNFMVAGTYSAGQLCIGLTAADVNGDNKPDLIAADPVGNALVIYTNRGNGSFVLGKNLSFANDWAPVSVVTADVNNDGKLDILTANYDDNSLAVLTNDGTGNFAVANVYPVGLAPNCVIAADVNGDGRLDFITADQSGGTLTVLTNNGHGSLSFSQTVAVPAGGVPLYVVAADVNGDQHLDLVAANYSSETATNNNLVVFTNNGVGVFGLNTTLYNPGLPLYANGPSVGNGFPNGVAAGDVNGDGRTDLISALNGSDTLTVYLNLSTPPQLTAVLSQNHQLILSWPNGMTGVTLQTNGNLATTNWGNYQGVISESNTVSLAPSAGQMFFRLK